MNGSLVRALRALALCSAMAVAALPLRAADIAGAMTADYLQRCVSNHEACREFTNEVLQILNTAAALHQARIYQGCAPWPLTLEDTGKLLAWILDRPQAATGYAADDIAMAAEALWPCK